jgi:hypothetical protein
VVCCAACCGAVAAVAVFGSVVLGSVVVVVPEVPGFAWLDGFVASSAQDAASCDLGCPLLAEFAVCVVVASGFA